VGVYIYKYDERTNGGGEHLGGKLNEGRDCMCGGGWRHRFFCGLLFLEALRGEEMMCVCVRRLFGNFVCVCARVGNANFAAGR